LKPDKCKFLRKEITYLGNVISETGMRSNLKKIEKISHDRVTLKI